MTDDHHDDELLPEQTEGFKVGEKKTIDEYQQLGGLPLPFALLLQLSLVSGALEPPTNLSSLSCFIQCHSGEAPLKRLRYTLYCAWCHWIAISSWCLKSLHTANQQQYI